MRFARLRNTVQRQQPVELVLHIGEKRCCFCLQRESEERGHSSCHTVIHPTVDRGIHGPEHGW